MQGKFCHRTARVAYTDAGKKLIQEKPETFDPKKLGVVGIEAVKELVKGRMKVMQMRRESILERMSGAMNQYLLGIDIGTSAYKVRY